MVFGLAIMGFAALLCFKLIPPFFAYFELEDAMKTEATQSTYSTRTDDIRASIVKVARNYDIALTEKQVRVSRSGGYGSGTLGIEAEYSVPVEIPGYSTTITFHPSSQNKGVF